MRQELELYKTNQHEVKKPEKKEIIKLANNE